MSDFVIQKTKKKELKKVVKKNKVIALLMAGVMTILQPASIYAADMTEEAFAFESESVNDDLQSEQETVEDNSGSGIFDDGGFTSDFDTADTEESVEDNSGGDAFITSSETSIGRYHNR